MQCPECRTRFEPRRSDQAYCSARCNKAGATRELARGRRIYRALYHWRLEHRTFGENMKFVCREVAAWIKEDRESQRLPPPPHDHSNDRGHQRPARLPKLKTFKPKPATIPAGTSRTYSPALKDPA